MKIEDEQVLLNTFWSLARIADQEDDSCAQQVMEMDIIHILIKILKADNIVLLAPVMRIIGNVASGPDNLADVIFLYYNLIQSFRY